MPQQKLTETLQELVRRHGISSILQGLAEIHDSPEPPTLPSSPMPFAIIPEAGADDEVRSELDRLMAAGRIAGAVN